MAKPSSTARGYNYQHQQRRKRLLAHLADGTPCPLCLRPMWKTQRLHLDHTIPIALGGQVGDRLVHGRCNESRGAKLGNAIRARMQPATRYSRRW